MQPKLWLLLIAGVFAADTVSTSAHHSFAGTYLEDQVITIEGDLVDVVYRNPHSFITGGAHRPTLRVASMQ